MPTSPSIQLRLLGDPALITQGGIKPLERRAAGLLALVALEPGVTRSRAAGLLWPHSDDARRALRQQILRFKKNHGVQLIDGDDALTLAAAVAVDVWTAAHGVVLGDLAFDDCEDFNVWLIQQRRQRSHHAISTVSQQLAEAQRQGDLDAALHWAEQLLLADGDSEVHHRTLMQLHYLRGDVAQAQAVFERLQAQLRSRFDAQPSPETAQLARTLKAAQQAQAVVVRPAVPVTVLRPPRMIGRQNELQALQALHGQHRAALLLGEPGLGKSRLLAEFVRGRAALSVQGRPGDASLPYATLVRLLRQTLERCTVQIEAVPRSELARLMPELGAGLTLPAEGQRLMLQSSIQSLLASARLDSHPIDTIVIDDLHFADEASVEMLQGLISALHERIHFVLAQRQSEGSAACGVLRDALEEGHLLSAVTLAPLNHGEITELLDSLQITNLETAPLAAALGRHCGGNPLYMLETIKQAMASGQLAAGQLPLPGSVGTLIERRLKQLSDKAMTLARVAAIAGVDFSIALAEQATGERALALTDAWNELQSAQVLRETAFAHDLVADAVLASVPSHIAQHLHGEIAQWLQAHGGEPARVAAHWQAAGQAAQALPWLHQAADQAALAMRPREASQFLLRAFEIESTLQLNEPAYRSLARVVELRMVSDQDSSLLPLLDQMDALAQSASQRIQALLVRADYAMHRLEGLDAGLAAASAAVRLADESHASELTGLALEARATMSVLQAMQGQYETARHEVGVFLPLARRWPHTEERCNLLGKAAYVMARTGQPQSAAALFEESVEQAQGLARSQVVGLANAAQARIQLNEAEVALGHLDRSDALRAAHDTLRGSGHSNAWMRVWALQLLGRYAEALPLFDGMLDDLAQLSPGKLPGVLVDRARLWLQLGQPARALQDRERARQANSAFGGTALHTLDLHLACVGHRPANMTPAPEMPHYHAVRAALMEGALRTGAEQRQRWDWALTQARASAYRGLEAAALARLAQHALQTGQVEPAAEQAQAAVTLAKQRNTDDLSWPELVMHVVPPLQAAGFIEQAQTLVTSGVAWVQTTAAALPAPLQPAMVEHHAVHRRLIALARRSAE